MENKEVQALDSEYLLSLMKQANTDKDAAFELGMAQKFLKIPEEYSFIFNRLQIWGILSHK